MGSGLDVKIFLLLQAAGVGQGVATPLVGAFYHHFLQSLSDRFLVRQRIPFGIDFYVRQRGDSWEYSPLFSFCSCSRGTAGRPAISEPGPKGTRRRNLLFGQVTGNQVRDHFFFCYPLFHGYALYGHYHNISGNLCSGELGGSGPVVWLYNRASFRHPDGGTPSREY